MARSTKHAFAFVWVTVLLDMVGLGLIMPILPALLRELTGSDVAHASIYGGWLFFAYALMQFFCAPVIGALSDAFGRRPVLLLAVLGLGVDYALTALSPSIVWLFAGRIIAGIFGASYTTANAYIADVTPPEERGKAFGMLGAAFGVGFVVGPAIGGLLGDLGPRVPFFVAAGLSLANFLYGLFLLPETLEKEKRRPVQLSQIHPFGAIVGIPGGRAVRTLVLSLFALFLGSAVYPAVWSFWSSARFDWSPRTIGISLAVYGVTNIVTQAVLVGSFTTRWGEQTTAFAGLVITIVSFVLTGLATQTWMVFAIIIVTAPAAVAMPAMQAWMSKLAPDDAQGRLQGAIGAAESLSSIFGPILMTQVFGAFEHRLPGAPFFVAAVLSVAALAIALRTPRG
ncbi:MAG TPA: TCR/Tet family MFS transporter [Polyangiaceae bacterium]|nr:TCR/Tet family MFS transporter [Polyangiaceae bacterium]